MRIIKRYSNRRLYDTTASATITHRDIVRLIRKGEQITVIDSADGSDITTAVLGRIMASEAVSWDDSNEPKDLLQTIIEYGGHKPMSILKNTILASIGAFQVTKAKAEKIIDELIKKGDLKESDRKKAVLELLDKAEKSTAKFREKVSGEAGKAQKEISKLVKEIQQYKLVKKSEVKKLEDKVDKLTKAVNRLEKKLSAK